jgi:hypothetical protein
MLATHERMMEDRSMALADFAASSAWRHAATMARVSGKVGSTPLFSHDRPVACVCVVFVSVLLMMAVLDGELIISDVLSSIGASSSRHRAVVVEQASSRSNPVERSEPDGDGGSLRVRCAFRIMLGVGQPMCQNRPMSGMS